MQGPSKEQKPCVVLTKSPDVQEFVFYYSKDDYLELVRLVGVHQRRVIKFAEEQLTNPESMEKLTATAKISRKKALKKKEEEARKKGKQRGKGRKTEDMLEEDHESDNLDDHIKLLFLFTMGKVSYVQLSDSYSLGYYTLPVFPFNTVTACSMPVYCCNRYANDNKCHLLCLLSSGQRPCGNPIVLPEPPCQELLPMEHCWSHQKNPWWIRFCWRRKPFRVREGSFDPDVWRAL